MPCLVGPLWISMLYDLKHLNGKGNVEEVNFRGIVGLVTSEMLKTVLTLNKFKNYQLT